MAAIELLQTRPFPVSDCERDLDGFVVHKLWEAPDPDALIAEVGPRVRGLIANGPTLISEALLARLPSLEIVANFGVGYDRVDVDAATRQGVLVTNTPGVLDDEVADLTIGLLLSTLRRIPQADRYLRAGHWLQAAFPLSPSLRGRKIGILGLGNIGLTIAKRLSGFDVEIAYHSRRQLPDAPYTYFDSPSALASAVDVLILILPGTPQTHHLINAGVLEKLGPNGVLINVARGSVVDEDALITALANGTILAAGLDVFEHEPAVPAALIEADNVVLLPHIGSASEQTRRAMAELVIANVSDWFSTRQARTPVNQDALASQP